MIHHRIAAVGLAVTLSGAPVAHAQGRPEAAALIAAEREASPK